MSLVYYEINNDINRESFNTFEEYNHDKKNKNENPKMLTSFYTFEEAYIHQQKNKNVKMVESLKEIYNIDFYNDLRCVHPHNSKCYKFRMKDEQIFVNGIKHYEIYNYDICSNIWKIEKFKIYNTIDIDVHTQVKKFLEEGIPEIINNKDEFIINDIRDFFISSDATNNEQILNDINT